MEQINLGKRALLVTLHISQWYNHRVDQDGVNAVKNSLHVDTVGDVYMKQLIPKTHMKPIKTLINTIRDKHYELTLPWLDNGLRLLPSTLFMEYSKSIGDLRLQLLTAVDHLCENFPKLVEEARTTKGSLFREKDYPSVPDLRRMFEVSTPIIPFPSGADFRVSLDEETLKELAARSQKTYLEMTERAVGTVRTSLEECLQRVYFSMKGDKLRTNSLDRLAIAAELAGKMNVTEDPRLDELVKLANQILEYHADMYKESELLRINAIKLLEAGM